MVSQWNFPENGGGQIRGIADSGMETFRGERLRSLAREICQNSLDALKQGSKCVEIEFEYKTIEQTEIPGYQDFKSSFLAAYSYWNNQNSDDAKSFLEKAVQILKNGRPLLVLRIGDYNTTGLSHPYNYKSMDGWNSLTRLDGGATKSGATGGSFGIGKNAPFVNSDFRLVFYRTLNEENQTAAQGMLRLVSFPKDVNEEKITTGFGYYGNPEHNMPVPQIPELERLNHRDKTGTDVFIYGFKSSSEIKKQTWDDNIKSEIISNFLIALYQQKLVVTFRNGDTGFIERINHQNFGEYAKKYYSLDKRITNNKDAYNTCLLLANRQKVKEFSLDFHHMGVLHLYILLGDKIELNHKVLVVRKLGMKLFTMVGMSRMVNFTGILELEGDKLNEYFRKMETPDHTNWKPKIHPNPLEAERYYKELRDWVQQNVIQLGDIYVGDETEVKGLSKLLQENESEDSQGIKIKENEAKKKETLKYRIPAIEVEEQPQSKKERGVLHRPNTRKSGNQKNKIQKEKGNITPDGSMDATRILKGTRRRKTRVSHRGEIDSSGHDIVNKPVGNSLKNIPLEFVRIMRVTDFTYRMMFYSPVNVPKGHIELMAIGENGKSIQLNIQETKQTVNIRDVHVSNGKILFKGIFAHEKVKVDFSLGNANKYAMEVHAYEDN